MKEQIVWACECGDTIKFSGLDDSFTRPQIESLIAQHERLGHEPVLPAEANLIRSKTNQRRTNAVSTSGLGDGTAVA